MGILRILATPDHGPAKRGKRISILCVSLAVCVALSIAVYPSWKEHRFRSGVLELNRQAKGAIAEEDYMNALVCQGLVVDRYLEHGKPIDAETEKCVKAAYGQIPLLRTYTREKHAITEANLGFHMDISSILDKHPDIR